MSPAVRLIVLAASCLGAALAPVLGRGQGTPVHSVPKANALVGRALALDGNTILLDERIAVRLWGIAAPEISSWPWGPQARRQLDGILSASSQVLCELEGQRLSRIEARCWPMDGAIQVTETAYIVPADLVQARDVGAMLIDAGYAVEYRSLTRGYPPYREREEAARSRKVGIWRD